MSEPGAGTDVLGMSTKASQNGDEWVINGTKMWITNGTVDGVNTGDAFLDYARTGEKRTDLSMFIVEKDMPGFALGQKIEDKLGMRASMTAELVFEDVVVPKENMVGSLNGVAICMMRNLEVRKRGEGKDAEAGGLVELASSPGQADCVRGAGAEIYCGADVLWS